MGVKRAKDDGSKAQRKMDMENAFARRGSKAAAGCEYVRCLGQTV